MNDKFGGVQHVEIKDGLLRHQSRLKKHGMLIAALLFLVIGLSVFAAVQYKQINLLKESLLVTNTQLEEVSDLLGQEVNDRKGADTAAKAYIEAQFGLVNEVQNNRYNTLLDKINSRDNNLRNELTVNTATKVAESEEYLTLYFANALNMGLPHYVEKAVRILNNQEAGLVSVRDPEGLLEVENGLNIEGSTRGVDDMYLLQLGALDKYTQREWVAPVIDGNLTMTFNDVSFQIPAEAGGEVQLSTGLTNSTNRLYVTVTNYLSDIERYYFVDLETGEVTTQTPG